MKRISSRSTFFYKRVFPLLWFGFIGVSVFSVLRHQPVVRAPPIPFLIVPVLMTVIGYVLFRKLLFDLVDEVWDDQDALIIKNAGVEERVSLENIINIGFSTMTNPERVTLTLRDPGRLGNEITFIPPRRFLTLSRSPIVNELIERVDVARRAKS
jgi:hypothetical protein